MKFPLGPKQVQGLTDSNWGPQDQSIPKEYSVQPSVDLFKTRSIAGYIIWLGGPLDWMSKRQSYTARSSAQAEIGAIDECTKTLQQIINILKDLQLDTLYCNGPIPIHNDAAAAVQWSHNMTTKGLRHIQIRENAVRESIQSGLIDVKHITSKLNPSDMFRKEDKDVNHFIKCRDSVCARPPPSE